MNPQTKNAEWQTDHRGEPISDETAKRIAEMLLAMARKKLANKDETAQG